MLIVENVQNTDENQPAAIRNIRRFSHGRQQTSHDTAHLALDAIHQPGQVETSQPHWDIHVSQKLGAKSTFFLWQNCWKVYPSHESDSDSCFICFFPQKHGG